MKQNKNAPLFTILKRDTLPKKKAILIRCIITFCAFILSMALSAIIIKDNPFTIVGILFVGAFNDVWRLFFITAILLGFGIAIVPAFKMKYWNMGANGQVMVGCLAACVCMFYLGTTKISSFLLIIIMLIVSIVASVIWAVIPAIFKAFFNTNETLFTLMTNYIAMALVSYMNFVMTKGKQETPGVINLFNGRKGWIYIDGLSPYFVPIIIIMVISFFMYFYISKTVHGFEISVLGDSRRTAEYADMKTKWITIRTLIVSGIITGIIGFLYASAIDHMVSVSTGGYGFTGILIAWISSFNPLIMAGVSFLLAFITNGTSKICSSYRLGSDNLSNVVIGIIFFSLLLAEFIIRYRVKFNFLSSKKKIQESEVEQ